MISVTTDSASIYQGRMTSLLKSNWPSDLTDDIRIMLNMDQLVPAVVSSDSYPVNQNSIYIQEDSDQILVTQETDLEILLEDS